MQGFAGNLPQGSLGFLIYTLLLLLLGFLIPPFYAEDIPVLAFLGLLALWRYGWGLFHYGRYLVYTRKIFPALRHNLADQDFSVPRIYIVLTSFRIEVETSLSVFRATVLESVDCGYPVTIVCSFVELSDEFLMKKIFQGLTPPAHVRLLFVRIPGTGKRDGLAQGFRAISRDMPPEGSLTIVLDGDSMMEPGLIRKCVPFFCADPALGALTTDEDCVVYGSSVMKSWHHLRFSQRQILMGSMALSGKVLTLTGRMSMFRTSIVTHPDFIRQIEHDSITHWRLGHFRFLTGDDKSSWFWVLQKEYRMMYVPDALVMTAEHPPSPFFFKASTMLMLRWFGNMMRTNGRALSLGPARTGLFTWWCLLDQRISMWTCLTGPAIALMLAIQHGLSILLAYLLWVGWTRWVMSLMLLSSRWSLHWSYPFLIYYNQVWGSLVKTYAFFHLDRQSWTRQKTRLDRNMGGFSAWWAPASSTLVHGVSLLVFMALIGLMTGTLDFPAY